MTPMFCGDTDQHLVDYNWLSSNRPALTVLPVHSVRSTTFSGSASHRHLVVFHWLSPNRPAPTVMQVLSAHSTADVLILNVETVGRFLAMIPLQCTAPSIWHKRLTGVRVFGCADISQVEQDERIGDVNEDVSTCPAGYNGSGVPDPHVVFQPCSNTASLELMDGVLKLMEAYTASLELMDGLINGSGVPDPHVVFLEVLKPRPGVMVMLSRPDSHKNGSTSSTFECDGDEGSLQHCAIAALVLFGTLGVCFALDQALPESVACNTTTHHGAPISRTAVQRPNRTTVHQFLS